MEQTKTTLDTLVDKLDELAQHPLTPGSGIYNPIKDYLDTARDVTDDKWRLKKRAISEITKGIAAEAVGWGMVTGGILMDPESLQLSVDYQFFETVHYG